MYTSTNNTREAAVRWLILAFGLSRAEAVQALDTAHAHGGRHRDRRRGFDIEVVPTRHRDRGGNPICLYTIRG